MATDSKKTTKQMLGDKGEKAVTKLSCPRCKRTHTLKLLRENFKCADIICNFCGYLAQVKTATSKNVDVLPKAVAGASWGPQYERMAAGIFTPLFIVLVDPVAQKQAIYYLPADLQSPAMFQKRNRLSPTARRAGWQGYTLRLDLPESRPVPVGG